MQRPLPLFAVASQYVPVDKPAHEDDEVPHLHTPALHVSPDGHKSTFAAHLQSPFPLFAVASQYDPLEESLLVAQEFRDAVHLQALLASSQKLLAEKSKKKAYLPIT